MSTRSKRTTRGDASASAAAVLTAGVAAVALPSDATAAAPAAAESAPAAAAAPRSAKKSKSKAKQAEPAAMEDVQEEEAAAVSAATAASSSSESSGGWSVAALLAGVNGRQVAEDSTEAAAQMRTLQQAILKQSEANAQHTHACAGTRATQRHHSLRLVAHSQSRVLFLAHPLFCSVLQGQLSRVRSAAP